ncbi:MULTISPECIES: phage tail protein [Thalassospira]|uniref:Tail fiber protein n=1 Tax=Thalassospira aquimaris TaxID=3037796 RepID=A0ABT6GFQ7_9PROT|nr:MULTISPECIES: tail fiber protein [Thalassospira]MDG4720922.1 tail fiber protein [Thalassospira sp. FZY0004]
MFRLNKRFTIAAMMATIVAFSMPETAKASCSSDPTIGDICWMATDFCPQNYLPADGQVLQAQSHQALYSLLGITYGGNATTLQFQLPDLRGRSVIAEGNYYKGTVLRGQKRGASTSTMNATNLMPHIHEIKPSTFVLSGSVKANSTAPDANSPAGGYPALVTPPALDVYGNAGAVVDMKSGIVSGSLEYLSGNTTVTGAGTPIPVTAPRLGLTACIAITGYYPQRP